MGYVIERKTGKKGVITRAFVNTKKEARHIKKLIGGKIRKTRAGYIPQYWTLPVRKLGKVI